MAIKNNFMKNIIIVFITFCFISFSCTKKKLNQVDYMRYVENEENGLRIIKNMGEVNYILQYKPIDYVQLKENRNSETINLEELEDMQYYTLSYALKDNYNKDILRYDLNSQNEYYERVNYFSYGFPEDIFLVEGKDTIACDLFNYVRSYGLSPRADFIIGFKKTSSKNIEDKLVVVDDKVYGGGIIKLKILAEDLENIPEQI